MTETWLRDGQALRDDAQDLSLGAGLGIICKNRPPASNGVTYGGVAIIWKEAACAFREIKTLKNPEQFEILVGLGTVAGQSRKIVCVAAYLPPGYTKTKGEKALEFISDTVVDLKRRYNDPYIIVGGDFNQWNIEEALLDFADIREVDVGNTRGDRSIDKIFTNAARSVISSGTLAPLQTDDDSDEPVRQSDHRVAYCSMEIKKKKTFTWEKYSYRHFSPESIKLFKDWIIMHDWAEVFGAEGSNKKADAYQKTVVAAIERFFPLKTTRRRSTDLPWLNRKTLKRIDRRKRLFWQNGGKRTEAWREEKVRIEDIVRQRKKEYLKTQKGHILADDASRNFFKHVKNFNTIEKPKQFDVRELLPGKNDVEVTETLAEYFNRVSQEFDPLQPNEIPQTKTRTMPGLQYHIKCQRG